MAPQQSDLRLTLDPRTKMALALMAIILIVSATRGYEVGAVGAMPLVTLLLVRGAWADLWRWLRWVLPTVLFFGLVTALAFSPGEGAIAGLKLLWLTLVGFVLFTTTAPEDLSNALIKSGVPFRIAFVVGAGMQFVPVLARKARAVMEAQQARGIPIGMGLRAIRHYPALLLPLLVQAFQLAEELAEAMESRGFGRGGRTCYRETVLRKWDWGVMIGAGLATMLLILGSKRW